MNRSPTTPRITVVNDSAEFLDLMRDVLTDVGYAVTTFEGDERGSRRSWHRPRICWPGRSG